MYELNSKIRNMVPYDPIEGEYSVRLDANESSHNLPEWLVEKIQKRVGEIDFRRYPDPYAKEAIEKFADFYGLNPDHVTAGNGSDELIGIIASAFLEKGDTVLTYFRIFPCMLFTLSWTSKR